MTTGAQIGGSVDVPGAGNRARGIVVVVRWLVAGLFAFAAVSKLIDLESFRNSLDTWMLIPAAIRPAVAVLVPSVELSLALLFMGWPRRSHYLLFGVMLVLFTGFYAAHLIAFEPPDCNCFLKIEAFSEWKSSVMGVIPRNIVLLLIWSVGCVPLEFQASPGRAGGGDA